MMMMGQDGAVDYSLLIVDAIGDYRNWTVTPAVVLKNESDDESESVSSDASDGLVPFGPPKSAFSFEFESVYVTPGAPINEINPDFAYFAVPHVNCVDFENPNDEVEAAEQDSPLSFLGLRPYSTYFL